MEEKIKYSAIQDDFSDLFGSDYHSAKPTVQAKPIPSEDELKRGTAQAMNNFTERIAGITNFCKVCGKPVTNVFQVKYKSGRIFRFQQPCGHKL